jgi:hypothetical protein
MDFDTAGNLYVANTYDNDIMKFTPSGVGSVFATGLSGPSGLVIVPEPSTCAVLVTGVVCLVMTKRQRR